MHSITSFLQYFAYGLSGVLSLAIIYFVANRKSKPAYSRLSGTKIYSVITFYCGATVAFLMSFIYLKNYGFTYEGFLTVITISIATYIFVLSIYTDHLFRKFDRKILYIATFIVMVLGIIRLIQIDSEPIFAIYIVSIVFSLAGFFYSAIGASDIRTIIFIFIAGIPTLGPIVTIYAFGAGAVLCVLYGIFFAIKKKTTKVSIPMVPYLMLPFVIAIFWVFV